MALAMATMTERLDDQLCGLGHELLLEWAPWVRDDNEGRASWAVKPRVGKAYHGDMPRRIAFVDKIVATHRREHPPYWRAVSRYYLGQRALWEIARDLGWSEERVLTTLIVFCGVVEREYNDKRGNG